MSKLTFFLVLSQKIFQMVFLIIFEPIESAPSRPSNASSNDTGVTAVVPADCGGAEAVRRELEEKAELLRAAYQAMEALEREREGERAELQVGKD